MDSVQSFLDALRSCRVLDDRQLEEVIHRLLPRIPNDPRGLAAELLKRRWVTAFQINRIFAARGSELLVGGGYVLLDRLGEGGMGHVYRARNARLGRVVALKLIRRDLLTNSTAVERFRREIRLTAQLNHPNIIRALDADETEDGLYIVMEYAEGIDLGRLVQQDGPLEVPEACEYIRQAALGLQHAHERGLIHRDIKPPNLLRVNPCATATNGAPLIKLLDLGLARLQEPPDASLANTACMNLTQLGVILGTVDFIAPEQARDSSSVDIRADLYSLGCTFHYLLTGKPPFPGGSATEKLLKHTLDPPPALPQVSDAVRGIFHRLMEKRPQDRFANPAELASALQQLLANPEQLFPEVRADLPRTVPVLQLPDDQSTPRVEAEARANASANRPASASVRRKPSSAVQRKRPPSTRKISPVGTATQMQTPPPVVPSQLLEFPPPTTSPTTAPRRTQAPRLSWIRSMRLPLLVAGLLLGALVCARVGLQAILAGSDHDWTQNRPDEPPQPPPTPGPAPQLKAGQVKEFWVVGPFGSDLSTEYPPETDPQPHRTYRWGFTPRTWGKTATQDDGFLRFNSPGRPQGGAYYALSHLHTREGGKACLSIRTGCSFRLWLNGVELQPSPTNPLALQRAQECELELRPGVNTLLLKMTAPARKLYDLALTFTSKEEIHASLNSPP